MPSFFLLGRKYASFAADSAVSLHDCEGRGRHVARIFGARARALGCAGGGGYRLAGRHGRYFGGRWRQSFAQAVAKRLCTGTQLLAGGGFRGLDFGARPGRTCVCRVCGAGACACGRYQGWRRVRGDAQPPGGRAFAGSPFGTHVPQAPRCSLSPRYPRRPFRHIDAAPGADRPGAGPPTCPHHALGLRTGPCAGAWQEGKRHLDHRSGAGARSGRPLFTLQTHGAGALLG